MKKDSSSTSEGGKTERKNFALRMPESLREQVETWAANSGRSVNAEICYLLERAMRGAKLSEFHDEQIIGECLRRFPGTKLTVTLALTEDQFASIKRRTGDRGDDDEEMIHREPD